MQFLPRVPAGNALVSITLCVVEHCFQGGFVPDIVLYLSYFFTKKELTIRLAWFWVSNYVSHIVGVFGLDYAFFIFQAHVTLQARSSQRESSSYAGLMAKRVGDTFSLLKAVLRSSSDYYLS
jgi:hypothetical protein